MRERQITLDGVPITPALSFPHDISLLSQLREDSVGPALGNAYRVSDIPDANARVIGDANEDVGVVGQEVPAR